MEQGRLLKISEETGTSLIILLCLRKKFKVVKEYKLMGVHPVNRVDWRFNCAAVFKKGQSRNYALIKLRSFSVCRKMTHIFYRSVVENIISSAFSWGC